MREWTPEQVVQLRTLRESGKTAFEIAHEMGRTINAIRRKIHKEFGSCSNRGPMWTQAERDQLMILRDEFHLKFWEISKRMGKRQESCSAMYYHIKNFVSTKRTQTGGQIIVPPELYSERNARMALMPRDTTAALMGDPLPGYSALERQRHNRHIPCSQ